MKQTLCTAHTMPAELRVHAVERALDLIEMMNRLGRPVSLTQASRKLRIPKSTAYYLIQTLVVRRYVQRIPGSRQYTSGVRGFDFQAASPADEALKQVAGPHIRELSSRLRMTVQTAVLRAGEGVIIDKASWPLDRWGGSWVGRHFDLHCTAQGKALIAWLSEQEVGNLFLSPKLARFTPRTICGLDELKKHLAEVRANGFALNDEEHILGIRAIAAPVFTHVGSVVASISVRGSMIEIPNEAIESLAQGIIEIADLVSREIQNAATC